jgi:hypothetical protein
MSSLSIHQLLGTSAISFPQFGYREKSCRYAHFLCSFFLSESLLQVLAIQGFLMLHSLFPQLTKTVVPCLGISACANVQRCLQVENQNNCEWLTLFISLLLEISVCDQLYENSFSSFNFVLFSSCLGWEDTSNTCSSIVVGGKCSSGTFNALT